MRFSRRFPFGNSALLMALSAMMLALPVRAAVIECGPNVCYEFDAAQAGVASFGLPVRVGDSMQFLPPSLLAYSPNGSGLAQTAASFVFSRIYSPSGRELQSLRVVEEGDYEIITGGSVTSSLQLTVKSNLSSEQYVTSDLFNAAGDSGGALLWDLDAALAPAQLFTGSATDLRLTLENLLAASTLASGTLAWNQKKFVSLSAVPVDPGPAPVPLPAGLGLFTSALALAGWIGQRRSIMTSV